MLKRLSIVKKIDADAKNLCGTTGNVCIIVPVGLLPHSLPTGKAGNDEKRRALRTGEKGRKRPF
jgi:hypothetical protein